MQSLKSALTKNFLAGKKIFCSPLLYRFSSQYPNTMFITAQQASQYTEDQNVKFLDIRDIEDYKLNHIAANTYSGDMFFWHRSETAAKDVLELKDRFQNYLVDMGVNKNDYLIAYEDQLNGRKGASCRAYYLLKLFGHENVSVINGGLQSWINAGYGMTSEVRELPKGNWEAGWNNNIWADKQDVLKTVQNKDRTFLDVRDHDEWIGESSSPLGKDFVPRKGRLEGAKWLFWEDLMTERNGEAYINEPEVVRKQMQDIGVSDLNEPITVYCFKGARASNTFMALRNAGFTDVKNYFGSWNEWAVDQSLPIDGARL